MILKIKTKDQTLFFDCDYVSKYADTVPDHVTSADRIIILSDKSVDTGMELMCLYVDAQNGITLVFIDDDQQACAYLMEDGKTVDKVL